MGVLQFAPIYHPLHDVFGIHTEVCVLILVVLYVLIVWSSDRHPSPQARSSKNRGNKKVLLRERKRHTARCVANTPYVVLTWFPPPGGGTRTPPPPRGYPVRYHLGGGGYPVRYHPPRGGYLTGYPRGGGSGYPPSPPCGQTNTCENSTFPSYYVRGR